MGPAAGSSDTAPAAQWSAITPDIHLEVKLLVTGADELFGTHRPLVMRGKDRDGSTDLPEVPLPTDQPRRNTPRRRPTNHSMHPPPATFPQPIPGVVTVADGDERRPH